MRPAGSVPWLQHAARWGSPDRFGLALAVLAPLLLYLPTLGYGFIYDDLPLVANNPAIRSLDAALGYFGRDFDAYSRGWEGTQSNYYRPLLFLAMAVLWPWAGDDPSRWHAVVVLLNAGVGGAAFWVFRLHGLATARALFASLLFSLHPLHVHSAAWITGLHDVLAALVVLVGYAGLARWLGAERGFVPPDRPRYGSLLLFVLGAASAVLIKESSLALPLLAVVLSTWVGWRQPDARRAAAATALLALCLALAYLALRVAVLGALAVPFPSAPDWPAALASIAPLIWAYLGAWVWPVDLSLFSPFRPVAQATDPALLLPWLSLLALAIAALWAAARHPRWVPPLLLVACFLAPHLNLRALNPEWALMHRYLYLPSLGLAWMLVLLPLPARLHRALRLLATGLLAALAIGSLHDMRAYRDEAAFWDTAVRKDPASSAAWTEQGRLRHERGDAEGARAAWVRASALDPSSLLPRLRLGNLQFAQRDYAAAAATYRALIARSPDYPPAWRNLGSALFGAGDRSGALAAAAEAVRRFPRDADVVANAGTLYRLAGDVPRARALYEAVVELRPAEAEPRLRLALLQAEAGHAAAARRSLAALRQLPANATVREAAAGLERQLQDHP